MRNDFLFPLKVGGCPQNRGNKGDPKRGDGTTDAPEQVTHFRKTQRGEAFEVNGIDEGDNNNGEGVVGKFVEQPGKTSELTRKCASHRLAHR